jgi:N-acetylglucosamine-6-phosphate deacetylase
VDRVLFANGRLVDPEAREPRDARLLVSAGRIDAILTRDDAAPEDARVIDLAGRWLAPAFLDLHFHGSAIFSRPESLHDALRADAASIVRHGVGGFLATTLAWPMTHLGAFVTQAASCASESWADAAAVLGLHLEGPWISPEAAGAQPSTGIAGYDARAAAGLLDRGEGRIRMVTYAPEIPGASSLQAELGRRGILGALGHSQADAATAEAATAAGARHVTHLFNAMRPFHHRAPGLAGFALADERLSCDLICDGVHVHPRAVGVAARAAAERLVLISDAIDPPRDGGAGFAGGEPVHADGDCWRLPDGRLAGSRLGLAAAARNLVRFAGASPCEAVAACSLRPARLLGVESERGSLRKGARADVVVLDADLRLHETWLGGRRVYEA